MVEKWARPHRRDRKVVAGFPGAVIGPTMVVEGRARDNGKLSAEAIDSAHAASLDTRKRYSLNSSRNCTFR